MRQSALERRVHEALREVQPPAAADAERRAWRVVEGAHAERAAPERRRRRPAVLAAVAAGALALVAALTPAGARVGDWIGDVMTPSPKATRSALVSLPVPGRLLVVADSGPWVVRADGARDRLGSFRDAGWSPGGRFVAAVRGERLTALEPDGDERWTRIAPGRVTTPRWSPDGYRIAYRSGRDLFVAIADNSAAWRLARGVGPTAPAWRPGRPDNRQLLAYAAGRRLLVAEADLAGGKPVVLGRTAPGPPPSELWWSADGRRLIAVSRRAVSVYAPRGRLLWRAALRGRLRVTDSALAPDGRDLALIAAASGAASSELLLMRTDRPGEPRRRLSGFGRLEGLTWSIDGRVLVTGLPQADQWLFLRMRAKRGLVSVKGIRSTFRGGRPARTGAFPRPAGWCYAKPLAPGAVRFAPCSTGG